MASNLKCNVTEMWTRPAAYIWKWDEDNDDEEKLKSGMIIRWQVLGYRHCSPKLL